METVSLLHKHTHTHKHTGNTRLSSHRAVTLFHRAGSYPLLPHWYHSSSLLGPNQVNNNDNDEKAILDDNDNYSCGDYPMNSTNHSKSLLFATSIKIEKEQIQRVHLYAVTDPNEAIGCCQTCLHECNLVVLFIIGALMLIPFGLFHSVHTYLLTYLLPSIHFSRFQEDAASVSRVPFR